MARVNRISVEAAMTTDKSPILFRVKPELRPVLEDLARDQNRSLSNLIETIIVEWMKQGGILPQPKPKRMKK